MIVKCSPRGWKYLFGCSALTVGSIWLVVRISAFVHIFGHHAGVILLQTEVEKAYYEDGRHPSTAVVPRIIHQIFHNWTNPSDETIPLDWSKARQSCIDLHDEWQHWLWTAEKSRTFVQEEYPWFLKTYDGFSYPVQRIDALRYFLLRHYGGIYMDLDNGCKASLEPLRYYPTWVVDGAQGALSNDILGAEPQHPFWIMMTDSLIPYAWNYPLPYITVSYATGQWFETEIWERYHREKPQNAPDLVRINTDFRPGAIEPVFFTHNRGGTWDNWDNHLFAWIGTHLVLFVLLLAAAISLCLFATIRLSRYVSAWARQTRLGYAEVDDFAEEEVHLRTYGDDRD